MDELLRAIKQRIGYDEGIKPRSALNAFRGEGKIFIVAEDEDAPPSVKPPYIELHAGEEQVLDQAAGQQRVSRVVVVRVVQAINRRDVAVGSETHRVQTGSELFPEVALQPGATGSTRPGVIEMARELVRILDGFRFDRDGLFYDFARYRGMAPPALVAEDEAASIVSIDIAMEYVLWRREGELV